LITEKHLVTIDGKQAEVSPLEFRLLTTLIRNETQVLTHEYLLEQVWGPAYKDERHYLKLYVWYLRQKIEPDVNRPAYILTERGVGYRLCAGIRNRCGKLTNRQSAYHIGRISYGRPMHSCLNFTEMEDE